MDLKERLSGAIPDNEAYRVVGYYINRMAGLEYALDRFLFAFAKEAQGLPSLSVVRAFPFRMAEKIDLMVLAYVMVPKLRSCGDDADYLSINDLALGLEEVWSVRNILVHGKIHFTKITGSSFRIKTHQFERMERNRYRRAEYHIGLGAVLDRLERARYVEAQLNQGTEILEGINVRAQQDQMRRERSKAKQLRADLKQWGYKIDLSQSLLSDGDLDG